MPAAQGCERPSSTGYVAGIHVFLTAAMRARRGWPGQGRDRRLPAGTRAIIERRHRAFDHGALDAALDRLMVQPQRTADRKKRGIFPTGEQYARPLDPARRLSSRLRYRSQLRRILISERQSIARRHAAHDFNPAP
jgi:hypothetical protein